MKKTIFHFAICLALCGMSACGNSNKENESNDSVAVPADSVVIADTTATEAIAVEVNPEEALSLTVEKKNLHYGAESSGMVGSWTVKVTNNSETDVNGSDYTVIYDEIVEETTADGDFEDVTKKRTVSGKDVAAGQSVLVELKAKEGCQDFKNPKIKSAK